MTFFDKHTATFHQANIINGQVETLPFLNAAQVLVSLLESMGTAFSPVRSDIQGNITKIKTRYDSDPAKSQTLEQIVQSEKPEKKKVATDALLWLKRGLEFTSLALRLNLDSQEELSESFSKAYQQTLSKHHSFLIRPVFSMAMGACPARAGFYQSLSDGDVPKLTEQMNDWVKGLESRLATIVEFYKKEGLDK